MNFTEATKRDAEEKFQQLDAGTAPSPITPPELDSFSQFEQKSKKFHDRIASQDMEVKRAFDTITANKNNRLAAEAAERKRIADAEAAERRKAEAAEKARLAEIKRKEDEERYRRWEREDRIKKIVIISLIAIGAIGIILGAIFGIRAIVNNSREKEYNNYSLDNIEVVVTGKESTIEYGYSTKYKTVISYSITNNCLKDIEYIEGKMVFYNGEEEFGSSTVSFTSSIESTRTVKMTVDFTGNNEVYQALYTTPLNKMKIEYKITSVTFEDNETKTYDEDYKVIHTPTPSTGGPFEALKDSAIGQTVTFGKFETNCDFNTTEDMEWIVVKKEGEKVLLISKMSLIAMSYGGYGQESYVSWKNSEVRNYLNGTFYYDCFTEEERKLIASTTNIPLDEEIELGAVQTTDKIFIPSAEELCEYFYSTNDMSCLSTGNIYGDGSKFGVYSISNDDFNDYCTYWLRDSIANAAYGDPGQSIFEEDEWSDYSGFDATLDYSESYYVRACLWIDLSAISE